ncbi:hypothetical protein VD0003_g9118 [Verticillium dahliae]|nr:hypothetical protein VD0003_g9118 [Verticillium dahliae]
MLTTAITHELYHHCILYFKPPSAYTLKTLKHVLFGRRAHVAKSIPGFPNHYPTASRL